MTRVDQVEEAQYEAVVSWPGRRGSLHYCRAMRAAAQTNFWICRWRSWQFVDDVTHATWKCARCRGELFQFVFVAEAGGMQDQRACGDSPHFFVGHADYRRSCTAGCEQQAFDFHRARCSRRR